MGDTVLFDEDALICKAVSDVNGNARFDYDLPLGKYYVKELKAPDGYLLGDQIEEVDAAYQGQDVITVSLQPEFKNDSTKVSISKKDITTKKEIAGAKLSVIDSKGNVVDSWTSEKGKNHIIKALHIGETYTLHEVCASSLFPHDTSMPESKDAALTFQFCKALQNTSSEYRKASPF